MKMQKKKHKSFQTKQRYLRLEMNWNANNSISQ